MREKCSGARSVHSFVSSLLSAFVLSLSFFLHWDRREVCDSGVSLPSGRLDAFSTLVGFSGFTADAVIVKDVSVSV